MSKSNKTFILSLVWIFTVALFAGYVVLPFALYKSYMAFVFFVALIFTPLIFNAYNSNTQDDSDT